MPSTRTRMTNDSTAVEATPGLAPARGREEAFERALLRIFLDDTLPRLQELRGAVAMQDPESVARQAHALIGGCQYLGAAAHMTAASKSLLDLGRRGCLHGAESLVARLETEFEKIRAAAGEATDSRNEQGASRTGVETEDEIIASTR